MRRITNESSCGYVRSRPAAFPRRPAMAIRWTFWSIRRCWPPTALMAIQHILLLLVLYPRASLLMRIILVPHLTVDFFLWISASCSWPKIQTTLHQTCSTTLLCCCIQYSTWRSSNLPVERHIRMLLIVVVHLLVSGNAIQWAGSGISIAFRHYYHRDSSCITMWFADRHVGACINSFPMCFFSHKLIWRSSSCLQ